MAKRGVNVLVVRLPQVHDPVKQGLITYSVAIAREKGVSPYIGAGLNRWPAVHVLDAAPTLQAGIRRSMKRAADTMQSLEEGSADAGDR